MLYYVYISEKVDLKMKHTSGTVNIMPEIAFLNLLITHYNRNELTQIFTTTKSIILKQP